MSLRPASPLLAPSLLSADFTRLGEELRMIEAAGAQVVHVDVMDGRFVPNITIGLPVVESLRKATDLPLDCHLMIVEPLRYAADFVKAGAGWVSIHQEADPHLNRTLAAIRQAGGTAGVVLTPGTPVETPVDLVGDFDFALPMRVNPAFAGPSSLPPALHTVKRLDALRTERGVPFLIQVDGGVSLKNAADLVRAGADCLVAGNAVFKAEDPKAAAAALLREMGAGRRA